MIQFTTSARQEIRRMRDRQLNPNLSVYLNIQSGGCLGWYYRLALAEENHTNDYIRVQDEDLRVLIESSSQPYVEGLVVDYSEDLMGGGFRFQNPNAVQACSCSYSFSIDKA